MFPQSTVYAPGTQKEETTMNGITFTVSALMDNLGDFVPALSPFSLGFAFTTGANLSTTHRYTYIFMDRSTPQVNRPGSLVIPMTLGFGIAYRPGDRLLLAADCTRRHGPRLNSAGHPHRSP